MRNATSAICQSACLGQVTASCSLPVAVVAAAPLQSVQTTMQLASANNVHDMCHGVAAALVL